MLVTPCWILSNKYLFLTNEKNRDHQTSVSRARRAGYAKSRFSSSITGQRHLESTCLYCPSRLTTRTTPAYNTSYGT